MATFGSLEVGASEPEYASTRDEAIGAVAAQMSAAIAAFRGSLGNEAVVAATVAEHDRARGT